MPRKGYTIHYIYKTTNILNGKYYIGMHSTFNIDDGYLGSGKRLWRSIKKYGKENFKKEILEFCTNRNKLKEREKQIINEVLLKDKQCINLGLGGEGGLMPNAFGGKEGRRLGAIKMNKTLTIKLKTDLEYRKRVCEAISFGLANTSNIGYKTSFLGKKHTEETKKKIGLKNSKNQKGEKNSQFGTCWITNGKENKKIKKELKIPNGWNLGRCVKLKQKKSFVL